MARKRHGKAGCMRASALSPPLLLNRAVADVLCIPTLRSKSGDMSSARVGAFAQRVARAIVQREVAVSHEGVDFHNMKAGSSSPLVSNTAINFSSFPSSSCLVHRPKSPFALLSASSIRTV